MDKYEQELFPSINSKRLRNSYENSYMNRFSQLGNPAEIYHENSKLHAYEEDIILEGLAKMYKTNNWSQQTFNIPDSQDLKENQKNVISLKCLDEQCNGFIVEIFDNERLNEVNDFTDIFVLVNGSVYIFNRSSREFILQIKNINEEDLKKMFLDEFYSECKIYLFLVARPWRYMRFIGHIGYRKCLLDLGALSEIILKKCCSASAVDFFYDNVVHEVLNLDGVESICLQIITVKSK